MISLVYNSGEVMLLEKDFLHPSTRQTALAIRIYVHRKWKRQTPEIANSGRPATDVMASKSDVSARQALPPAHVAGG
jgi:hypothetical protein